MKFLIVSVVLTAMTLYGLCDIISAMFQLKVSQLKRTHRLQTEPLVFCLLLYLAPVLALFSYRFQVLDLNYNNFIDLFMA